MSIRWCWNPISVGWCWNLNSVWSSCVFCEKRFQVIFVCMNTHSCVQTYISWHIHVCQFFQHHSYRSFQGFVCLMQVSTHTTDFLIDTLTLRSDMYILNEVFADPNITKVRAHPGRSIYWLQYQEGESMSLMKCLLTSVFLKKVFNGLSVDNLSQYCEAESTSLWKCLMTSMLTTYPSIVKMRVHPYGSV